MYPIIFDSMRKRLNRFVLNRFVIFLYFLPLLWFRWSIAGVKEISCRWCWIGNDLLGWWYFIENMRIHTWDVQRIIWSDMLRSKMITHLILEFIVIYGSIHHCGTNANLVVTFDQWRWIQRCTFSPTPPNGFLLVCNIEEHIDWLQNYRSLNLYLFFKKR